MSSNWKSKWEERIEFVPPGGGGVADIIIVLTHRDGTVKKVTGLSMSIDGCKAHAYRLAYAYSHPQNINRG